MVSDETAVGQYPYQTLEWLNKIIDSNYEVVDLNLKYEDLFVKSDYQITDHIIYEAWKLSEEMDIKAIICPTETGYTPARLSTLKPKVPIIAFTRSDDTFKYLNLLWGVK
jgi:pyruvate kinase